MATSHVGITSITGPLLPVTGSFIAPFTSYFVFLSLRVAARRLRDKIYLGDEDSASVSASSSSSSPIGPQSIKVASRAHGNFAEYVPFALGVAAVAELNGADRRVLTGALASLLALRVLHSEFGVMGEGAMGAGRPVGYYGSLAWFALFGGYTSWLTRGFWGL